MSTALQVDFSRRRPQLNEQMQRQAMAEKTRFLFSPLLEVDCRYSLAEFTIINPGRVRVVDVFQKPIPNTKRILEGGQSSEPEFVLYRRLPGVIARSIMDECATDDGIPTGLVELVEMIGLDPMERDEDAGIVADIQQTLWPVNYPTYREQAQWLNSVNAHDSLYIDTQGRLIDALDMAYAYADTLYVGLVGELSLRAAGGEGAKGHRNRLDKVDRYICHWLEREVPVIASPLVQAKAKEIRESEKPKDTLPTVQCLDCGHESNVIRATMQPPKRCGQCGEFFVKAEAEAERVLDAEELDAVTSGKPRKTLEEKQAETRARNGK